MEQNGKARTEEGRIVRRKQIRSRLGCLRDWRIEFPVGKGALRELFLKAPNLDLIVGGESLNASEVKNIWSSDGEAEESK